MFPEPALSIFCKKAIQEDEKAVYYIDENHGSYLMLHFPKDTETRKWHSSSSTKVTMHAYATLDLHH